jgi:hypothetical protein
VEYSIIRVYGTNDRNLFGLSKNKLILPGNSKIGLRPQLIITSNYRQAAFSKIILPASLPLRPVKDQTPIN